VKTLCLPTAAVLALLTLSLPALAGQAPTPAKPNVGEGLKKERERLASYQWRLKTEMKVDGDLRMQKVEDVHLAPDGGLVRKIVKFDKRPAPTPYPPNDPRSRLGPPASDKEEDRFADQAQELMHLYARLSPERVEEWAERAELMPPDPDRAGQLRMHGRGLGRPQDDAVLYLDPATKAPIEIEVKTTVDPQIVDIAFIRARFEPLPAVRPNMEPPIVPKKIFMNLNRGKRVVTLEMETTDYRAWP
jgi:hypothetical protein